MPTIRNNYGRSTLKYQIPYMLNELPNRLKNIGNKNIMKKELQ